MTPVGHASRNARSSVWEAWATSSSCAEATSCGWVRAACASASAWAGLILPAANAAAVTSSPGPASAVASLAWRTACPPDSRPAVRNSRCAASAPAAASGPRPGLVKRVQVTGGQRVTGRRQRVYRVCWRLPIDRTHVLIMPDRVVC
ncbi:MAG: hypothetical protein ACRDYX_15945 [Egibacteraceae bacterium]